MVDILSSQTIGYTVMARQNTEDRQTDSIAYKNQTPAQMLELMLTAQLDAARCVACLLYTSPSPRDKRQSRMPSSA